MSDGISARADDLTLEEKAALTSGADFWTTKAIERVGIPALFLTDGPHGLRKQSGDSDHLGLSGSVPATCFPPAVGLGASFDPDLAERVGVALGVESAIENVDVILGPGINIKRSPLCGRNFEYMSEDPIVSGIMGAGLVRGIQSQGVGSSLKHFAANNQETDRLRVSSDVDPRTLREIYLRGFQRVVEDAQPWTIMCSYNRINGTYASEDPWLLTAVLRDEWAFEGIVVSDWGAVNDRVAGLVAGLDLEMPGSNGRTDAEIVAAVHSGTIAEAALDTVVDRLLDLTRKAQARPAAAGPLDVDAHHALAREAATRSIVLLRNEGDLLPLDPHKKLAVIGEFARTPRYQGAGSSQINPTRLDSALDEIRSLSTGGVEFAAGFTLEPAPAADAEELRSEAVATAASADVAVVFLGIPAEEESEGFDRDHIDLPAAQLDLLDAVLAVNPNVVVVLSNGGVVAVPFAERVPALVEAWLLGQAGGGGTADVLFGVVNPSGRLGETIPLRLEDTPAFGRFPGEHGHVQYGEGLLVGYRWYDARRMDVAFPFGHGLSYTSFRYGAATASIAADGSDDLIVSVDVTNTGAVAGREVVQAYASLPGSSVQRPPRELKAFVSVPIRARETAQVELRVRRSDLAYWDTRVDHWVVEGGQYVVEIGSSSRDIRTRATVNVNGDEVARPVSLESSFDELMDDPIVGDELRTIITAKFGDDDQMLKMLGNFPVGRLDGFPLPRAELIDLVKRAQRG